MSISPDNLVWIDLEMTGLNPDSDHIIEIATIVTDSQLNILAEGPTLAIHQPDAVLAMMDEWNTTQHAKSGLSDRVRSSTTDTAAAEQATLAFLAGYVPARTSPMCGNSICQDRRFLFRRMPALERFFHYRNLDVSTVKELVRRWAPNVPMFEKNSSHLALNDIRDSIEELCHYRAQFFASEQTMPNKLCDLPIDLYDAAGVRALDRCAIDEFGISGAELMERAGGCVFETLRQRWPSARSITVVCGTGNNGGDGFVVARRAHQAGLQVNALLVGDRTQVSGEAHHHLIASEAAGVKLATFNDRIPAGTELVVDALFGTGLTRAVEGAHAQAIAAMNDCGRPIIAVDIPSGVNADTGARMGVAVRADATVTFIGMKQGLLTGDAPDLTGDIRFTDLDVPGGVYAKVKPNAQRIARQHVLSLLPRRVRTGHKGSYGHVLVVGGERGYAGAVRMAGEAAARVGAGLVSIATRVDHAASIAAGCPVLMSHGIADADALSVLSDMAKVIAIGPGLGRSAWAQALFARVLECGQPLVVDADALNLLAEEPAKREEWILTPHPGEAARLLGCEAATIQGDRFAAAKRIQQHYGGVCVLKGAGTIVAGSASIAVCAAGNPGMGSGGMGDILTGVIAGLLAQGLSITDAAQMGVCLHAEAGDAAARDGERGLIATDLLPWLRRLANA